MTDDDEVIQPGRHVLNWFGNLSFMPAYIATPRSEADVLHIIKFARDNELPVRAHGAKHSHAPNIPTAGVSVSFDEFREVLNLDKDKLQITVRPGLRIAQLTRILRDAGMSLANQGDIDSQAIAGAIMTGTHGAGRRLACMATQVIALRIATSAGEILDLSEAADAELFRAARVSIGMFGLVLSLTIQAVPSYNILKRSWNMDVEDLVQQLPGLIESHRTCYHLWLPHLESIALLNLPVDGYASTATRDHDICHLRSYDAIPVAELPPALGTGEVFGHSSEIFPNVYVPNFMEIEYTVPFAAGLDAFGEIRERILTHHKDAFFPIEFRAVAADDSYISPFSGREGVAVSCPRVPEGDYWGFLHDMDAILDRYDARPHWGKYHFTTPARMERLYPKYAAFKTLRRRLDPSGMFLNDLLRPLFL
jgi:FAD/FMN-containing dehydrogenase